MGTMAKGKYLRITPRKLRGVADLVRDRDVSDAFSILSVTKKRGCLFVEKVLKSAVANAQNNLDNPVDIDKLYVKEIFVDDGPMRKQWLPRAMGRATIVKKRSSHLTVNLDERT
jgi:large subunit ribosomal protein L22